MEKSDRTWVWYPSQMRGLLNLPLPDLSHAPPVSMMRPESEAECVYFDNTLSGPYRGSEGHHLWTDGSQQSVQDAELTGAGLVGFLREYVALNMSVGDPSTNL
eukprot:1566940-Rhodomonas_salina.1